MEFYEISRYLRQEYGLSQKQLSEKIGVSSAAIGHLELKKHEPNSSTLIAYSKFFHVTTDYLLGIDSDEISPINISPKAPILSENAQNLLTLFHSMTHAQQVRFLAYGEGITGITVSKIPKN